MVSLQEQTAPVTGLAGLMHKEGEGKLDVVMSIHDGKLQCIIADNCQRGFCWHAGKIFAAELLSAFFLPNFNLQIINEHRHFSPLPVIYFQPVSFSPDNGGEIKHGYFRPFVCFNVQILYIY